MMGRARIVAVACSVLLLVSTICMAEPPLSDGAPLATACVTYLTASTVYLDAGAADGIAEGDELEVVRDGRVVARLRVFVVSSHKAGCRRIGDIDADVEIEAGDEVRYAAAAVPTAPTAAGAAVMAESETTRDATRSEALSFTERLRDAGFSGRVGVRYIMIEEPNLGVGYHRPGVDLRVRGDDLFETGIGLDVDARAYRSYRDVSGDSSTDSSNRIYRANTSWTGSEFPLRMALGRQFVPSLAAVSLFDGVSGEYAGDGYGVGVLGGLEPDPYDYGLSTDVQQYGAYGELRNRIGARRRWGATLGLIGSYAKGSVNREFLYLQGRYDDRRASLYLAQEVDLNRGWKKDAGESVVSSTSTFAYGRYRILESVALTAGFDNRRNVRLYRDRVDPVTEFDDAYRTGYWVGADGKYGRLRAGMDARISTGGSGGSAESGSLYLGAVQLTRFDIDVRSRTTYFSSDAANGWLESLRAGAPVGDSVQVALIGGLRDDQAKGSYGVDTRIGWYGFDVDVALGRHWFLLLSFERNQGSDIDNYQVYTSVSYRL